MSQRTIQTLPVTSIVAGSNDRQHFDERALQDLADSIAENGLAQPITVRLIDTDRYEIVAGERRFRAVSQVLKWNQIDCIVRVLDNDEASAIMLAENTSRADLNPIEEAQAYHKRLDGGWSIDRISKAAGVSPDLVERRLKLLSLVPEVQHLLRFGNLPIGHGEAMSVLDNNRQRIAMRVFSQADGMTFDKFRQLVNQLFEQQSQESLFDLEALWVDHVTTDNDLPRRGKLAVTNAPTRADLPAVKHDVRWNAAQIIDQYIADLVKNGHAEEAGAIGNLWTVLVHHNYMAVPESSSLMKGSTE